jgi:hypothetical protein
MTESSSRYVLYVASDLFRLERVRLIRERGEDAAEELTVRAAEFLTALAGEARRAYGKDDKPPSRLLIGRLARADDNPADLREHRNTRDGDEVAG